MAEANHTEDSSGGYGKELRSYRRLALAALDVAHGRLPLAALAWYRVPLCNGTERLFTPDEASQAQPHFDAKMADGFLGFAGERAEPPDLSKVDSHITTEQAQLIGITMDTAAKLSAFIDDAARRHTAATMASKNDPIGADPELSRSLRLHTAGMNVACGQAPLSTLA